MRPVGMMSIWKRQISSLERFCKVVFFLNDTLYCCGLQCLWWKNRFGLHNLNLLCSEALFYQEFIRDTAGKGQAFIGHSHRAALHLTPPPPLPPCSRMLLSH